MKPIRNACINMRNCGPNHCLWTPLRVERGLHMISLVRASGESFRRRVFDALEGTREARLLGEQFCLHPVLHDPDPPPRRAPRPDLPVVCPGFGLVGCLFVLPKKRPGQCLRFAGGQEGGLSPGRIDPPASRPTQPRFPSPLRRAPSRPVRPVVCPGLGFDRSTDEPVVNRLSNAGLFLRRFTWGFAYSRFWGDIRATCFQCLGGCGGDLSPG